MKLTKLRTEFVALLIITALTVMLAQFSMHAKELIVTDTSDNVQNPAPGSLRQCINSAQPGDTVKFSIPEPYTVTLSNSNDIYKSITIDGYNDGRPVIVKICDDDPHNFRAFNICDNARVGNSE